MNQESPAGRYARRLFFASQTQSSPTASAPSLTTSESNNFTKLRYNDWHNRSLSFNGPHDFLSHVLELAPGQDCPVKVLDVQYCATPPSNQKKKYCPGYLRRHDDTTTSSSWLSPMRFVVSKSTPPKWELINFQGSHLEYFYSETAIREVWGYSIISPIDHDGNSFINNDTSPASSNGDDDNSFSTAVVHQDNDDTAQMKDDFDDCFSPSSPKAITHVNEDCVAHLCALNNEGGHEETSITKDLLHPSFPISTNNGVMDFEENFINEITTQSQLPTPTIPTTTTTGIAASQIDVLAAAVQQHLADPSQDSAIPPGNNENVLGPESSMEEIARYLIRTVVTPVTIGNVTINDVASFLGAQDSLQKVHQNAIFVCAICSSFRRQLMVDEVSIRHHGKVCPTIH